MCTTRSSSHPGETPPSTLPGTRHPREQIPQMQAPTSPPEQAPPCGQNHNLAPTSLRAVTIGNSAKGMYTGNVPVFNIWRTSDLLWGHWYSYFGLLVPLVCKGGVEPFFAPSRLCVTYSCFSSLKNRMGIDAELFAGIGEEYMNCGELQIHFLAIFIT